MTHWIGCIDFGEPVKVLLSVGNQVLLLSTHAEQRLWKHNKEEMKMGLILD